MQVEKGCGHAFFKRHRALSSGNWDTVLPVFDRYLAKSEQMSGAVSVPLDSCTSLLLLSLRLCIKCFQESGLCMTSGSTSCEAPLSTLESRLNTSRRETAAQRDIYSEQVSPGRVQGEEPLVDRAVSSCVGCMDWATGIIPQPG